MPEGHLLHRLAAEHGAWLIGQPVRVSSPQGRFAAGATQLDGDVVASVEALGKHLLYTFESSAVLHVHLGLVGKFRHFRQPSPAPRGQVRLRLETAERCLDLSGPLACELLDADEHQALRQRLGPDVLRPGGGRAQAWARVKRSRRSIGALLLDQSIVSGVGNVYRAEALFVAGLHPELRGIELESRDFTRLWKTVVTMMQAGVRERRIVTVPGVGRGAPRPARTWVYRQKVCKRCGEAISTWQIANRTMYACETCQRR